MSDTVKQQSVSEGLRYRANLVVTEEIPEGVFLKRGSIEVQITGRATAEMLALLFDALAENALTKAELLELYPTVTQEAVESLINQLIDRRILEPLEASDSQSSSLESPTEIFFWESGIDSSSLQKLTKARRFIVLGVNAVARAMAESMIASGLNELDVVDLPNLRSHRFFDGPGALNPAEWPASLPRPTRIEDLLEHGAEFDCLVGTSDFGGMQLLREWNEFAFNAGCAFYPVVLQNMHGYLGPLVIPGETACFECYRARQNSHMNDAAAQRAGERIAHRTQYAVSFHPAMAAMLGNMAALELTKFFVGRIPGWHVGTVIEIDFLDPGLTSRKVLRVPRCKVCDAGNSSAAISLNERLFVPHQVREPKNAARRQS